MGGYIALVVATLAPFLVAVLPIGSKEKVGKQYVLTDEGWVEQ